MSVALIVGTPKGAAILRSKDRRKWETEFVLRGWPVTASVRDDKGRTYVAVNSPNFGVALFASDDDLTTWKQLDAAPRYHPEDRGNPEHHRLVAKMDFEGKLKGGGRFVDQIWTLHPAHGALRAGDRPMAMADRADLLSDLVTRLPRSPLLLQHLEGCIVPGRLVLHVLLHLLESYILPILLLAELVSFPLLVPPEPFIEQFGRQVDDLVLNRSLDVVVGIRVGGI